MLFNFLITCVIWFFWVLGIILIVNTVFLIYFHCSFWHRIDVKGPWGIPFVGNLFQFLIGRKHYGKVFKDIYDAYPNLPYVGIFRPSNEPCILLRSQEMIKEIMIKSFQHFQDNVLWVDEKRDPIILLNPFAAKGASWKERRSELVPVFTPNKVKLSFPHIRTICQQLDTFVANTLNRNCFEAKDLCSKYTLSVVASAAFGVDAQTFTDENSDFTTLIESVFLPNPLCLLDTIALIFWPTLGKLLSSHYVPKDAQDWLDVLIRKILCERLDASNKPNSDVNYNDFIQHLINAKVKANEPIDRTSIVGHCGTFLFEGFETSSTLMAFALYEYAVNMPVQQRILKEIDEVLARHNGELSYEALQEMTYLESSLYETLRLHPAMSALLKHCTELFAVPPQTSACMKWVADEGMAFVIPVLAIHTDPEIYPDPYEFKPERFHGKNEKNRLGCTFLGFGEGPRRCPGIRLGLAQSKAGLITLLAKYSVHLNEKTKMPLETSEKTFLLAAKNGIWLQLRQRN